MRVSKKGVGGAKHKRLLDNEVRLSNSGTFGFTQGDMERSGVTKGFIRPALRYHAFPRQSWAEELASLIHHLALVGLRPVPLIVGRIAPQLGRQCLLLGSC
jgi:hypothetical protein